MKHECRKPTRQDQTCPNFFKHTATRHMKLLGRHLDALGVVGEVAVLGVGLGAASVANGGADHAGKAPERRLRPPEAAQREHRRGRRSPARQRCSPDGAAAAREARARGPRDEKDEHPYDGRDGGGRCHGVCRRSGSGRSVTNRRVGWVVCCSSVWDYSKGRTVGGGGLVGSWAVWIEQVVPLMGLKGTFGLMIKIKRDLFG